MNDENEAIQIVTDTLAPRRKFLRNSLLLAVPVMMGGTAFSAVAAVYNPPARRNGGARINVRDHGARGNGWSDDTSAFQRAINALPWAGGTIVVPAGDYLLDPTRSVKLRSRMHLQLASGAKLLAKANSDPSAYVLYAEKANDVEISGGQIIGDRHEHRGGGEWGHGIMVRGCKRVTIRDMHISDCFGDGMSIASANVNGRNNPWAPSEDVVIANVVSTGNRRQGLSIGGTRNVRVHGCEFSNTRGTKPGCGIDIEPDVFNMDRADNIRIEDCLIRNNEGNGILVYHRVTRVAIKRCVIEHNDGHGVLTSGATRGFIALNKIRHNRLIGLRVSAGSADYTIAGNYFRNNVTRNNGIVGDNAAWSGTSWTRLTGEVGGWKGTGPHVSSVHSRNTRIRTNFYTR